jgi:2-polyprenyl-3-methyl-5-hydroxy-6-metoxy-1,4-benzoquinol methylase
MRMSDEFDRFAAHYDETLKAALPKGLYEDHYFAKYKIDFLSRATRNRTVASILDFGCGAGRSLSCLLGAFPQAAVAGYDPSSESIRFAAERVPAAKVTNDWAVVTQRRFDIVLGANVFHHVPRDQVPMWLHRCGEVLAPAGSIFVFEHNPWNPATRYVFERCPFDSGATMIPRRELIELGKKAGLEVKSVAFTLFFPRPLKVLRPIERWLSWLPLGAQYCVEFGLR